MRPNSFDGANDTTTYDTAPMYPSDQYQRLPMQQQQISNLGPGTGYAARLAYPDAGAAPCRAVPYDTSEQPGSISYGAVPPPAPMMKQPFASQDVFPTPTMQPQPAQQQASPEAYSPGEYQHRDLADLLGALKISETGTGEDCLS